MLGAAGSPDNDGIRQTGCKARQFLDRGEAGIGEHVTGQLLGPRTAAVAGDLVDRLTTGVRVARRRPRDRSLCEPDGRRVPSLDRRYPTVRATQSSTLSAIFSHPGSAIR